jgi:hypothetical protein
MCTKYFINHQEKAIVCGETGELLRPTCWNDLVLYHSYILGTEKNKKAANQLLRDVFRGEMVMTNMAKRVQDGNNYIPGINNHE